MAYAATHTSSVTSLNQIARGFIAGFASTLMFHQGMLMLLYSAGLTPNMPFVLQPTQPLGVMPLKGMPMGGGWHAAGIATALLVNGAWGLGTGLFLRLGHEQFAPPRPGSA